ncbi:hypothetical protein RCL1_007221 [Eukaryota sp. TZLM3-RCL]
MSLFLEKHPYILIPAFLILQLSLGIDYSFPTFSPFLINDYGWTATQTTSVYAAVSACFGVGTVLSGILLKNKFSLRFLTIITSILSFIGLGISGIGQGDNFILVFIGSGILLGIAVGNSYVCSVTVAVTYFPQRKGLVTGLCIGSYGSASLFWSLAAELLLTTKTPGFAFRLFALIAPVLILISGQFMIPKKSSVSVELDRVESQSFEQKVNIPRNASSLLALSEILTANVPASILEEDDLGNNVEPVTSNDQNNIDLIITQESQVIHDVDVSESIIDEEESPQLQAARSTPTPLSTVEILQNSNFRLTLFSVIIAGSSGFMAASAMRIFPVLELTNNGYNDEQIQRITFLAMGVMFNVGNGLGRLLMGQVVDMIGPGSTWVLLCLGQSFSQLLFVFFAGTPVLLYILTVCIATFFGSTFVCVPLLLSSLFSDSDFATVYSYVLGGVSVAGVLGPLTFGLLSDLGYPTVPFLMASVGMLVCVAMVGILNKRAKKVDV